MITDLYQITMASTDWKAGIAEREAVFHLSFRKGAFGGVLGPRLRRLLSLQEYLVGLLPALHELKWTLVSEARSGR